MKYHRKLGIIKWIGLPLAVIMYCATFEAFGIAVSGAVSAVFGVGFILICKIEKDRSLCEYVASDLASHIKKNGYEDARVDITITRLGLIVRVILVAAGEKKVKAINKLMVSRIHRADYRGVIFLSQIIDVDDVKFIKKALKELDNEVIRELKNLAGHKNDVPKNPKEESQHEPQHMEAKEANTKVVDSKIQESKVQGSKVQESKVQGSQGVNIEEANPEEVNPEDVDSKEGK